MKKILSAVVVFLLLIGLTIGVCAPTDDISLSYENSPCFDGDISDYDFTQPVTRRGFCVLSYNMLSKTGKIDLKPGATTPFFDCSDPKVDALHNIGIICGKGEGIFAPQDNILREEAAVILARIADKLGLVHTEKYFEYRDSDIISPWAMDSVQIVSNLGVMKGVGDDMFAPREYYTVEQAVITLDRIFDYSGKKSDDRIGFSDKLNSYMPDDQNYMFSPLSIKMALMMAANGANGETKQQILDVFGVDDLQSYNQKVGEMIDRYLSSDALKLNISNSVWINADETNQKFSEGFTDITDKYFKASAGVVTRNNALNKINGWVSENTNGKIRSILSEDNLNFASMLVNAVYFKGKWQDAFDKKFTQKDTFTDIGGRESQIDFMNRNDSFLYSDTDGVISVKLPYITDKKADSSDVNMYLMISDNIDFDAEKIILDSDFYSKDIRLSMPKFKIEYGNNMNSILKSMGITRAFQADAQFENMFDAGTMQISDIIHKTYIDVDEEGTEAAAVTSVTMTKTAMPAEPLVIKFNKPFIFVIRDDANNEILFMGKYLLAK